MSSLQYSPDDLRLPPARAWVVPVFRHRRAAGLVFVCLIAMVITAALLAERVYEAEMKVLVKRGRIDPVMTGEAQAPSAMPLDVGESELYAEVELLNSRDLLEQVVQATGLAGPPPDRAASADADRVARAVERLRRDLTIEPLRKTTMIHVAYRSTDPRQAASVLDHLSTLYLEKHLAVHRPAGAHQFFSEQADRYDGELRAAEARLKDFTAREQVVSPLDEKTAALQKVSEFEGTLQETLAAIADSTRRLDAIQRELASTPDREVTEVHDAGNVAVIRGLRAQILQLEIKRDGLLQKFMPDYPPVVALDREVEQLRAALVVAEQDPLRDQTTDRNPTHQWLRNEAARVQAEQKALMARADAIRRTVAEYTDRARRMDRLSIEQQDLMRTVKEAEDHYLLYRRKQEEARISDALDHTRIANVAVAEAPTVPQTPSSRRGVILAGGGFLAVLLSLMAAYGLHTADPHFRSPEEVSRVLDVVVLASLPASTD